MSAEPIAKGSNNDKPNKACEYHYYDQTIPVKVHHFYISTGVKAPEDYVDMIHIIRTAGSNDHIYLYLNTPGGRLDSTIQIINAMRASQARITTVVESEAHSAGTMLFLSGDEFIVHDNCYMLFHNFSGGAIGKGNEIKAQVEATDGWFRKLVHDVYRHFMTEDEIENMLEGKDYWFDSDEIRERLQYMVEQLQAELDDGQSEQEQPKPKAKKKSAPRKKKAVKKSPTV